jgi:hypothetical protein
MMMERAHRRNVRGQTGRGRTDKGKEMYLPVQFPVHVTLIIIIVIIIISAME